MHDHANFLARVRACDVLQPRFEFGSAAGLQIRVWEQVVAITMANWSMHMDIESIPYDLGPDGPVSLVTPLEPQLSVIHSFRRLPGNQIQIWVLASRDKCETFVDEMTVTLQLGMMESSETYVVKSAECIS